jgi:hypothetical protein
MKKESEVILLNGLAPNRTGYLHAALNFFIEHKGLVGRFAASHTLIYVYQRHKLHLY